MAGLLGEKTKSLVAGIASLRRGFVRRWMPRILRNERVSECFGDGEHIGDVINEEALSLPYAMREKPSAVLTAVFTTARAALMASSTASNARPSRVSRTFREALVCI